jgi:hypothetical protein
MNTIAENLIDSVKWDNYEVGSGDARKVGDAIRELLTSKDSAEAESAYWKLENHIVVQGNVYTSAVPATRILVASLLDDRPLSVRIPILDLFFQILSGTPANPGEDVVNICKKYVYEGFWLIVNEFVQGPRGAARDVLELINQDLDYESLV